MSDGLLEEDLPLPAIRQKPFLALGIGCERGCSAEEIITLAVAVLAEAGFTPDAVSTVASIELKRDEPGILALASALRAPVRFFPAERLLAETEHLSERSALVFRATGCWGVAEAAALAACGCGAALVASKRRSRRATCAIARASRQFDAGAPA